MTMPFSFHGLVDDLRLAQRSSWRMRGCRVFTTTRTDSSGEQLRQQEQRVSVRPV